jgi:hypothetical protein
MTRNTICFTGSRGAKIHLKRNLSQIVILVPIQAMTLAWLVLIVYRPP